MPITMVVGWGRTSSQAARSVRSPCAVRGARDSEEVAERQREGVTAVRLETLVKQISSLPTLPSALLRVTDLLNNPRTSALKVARLILNDQGLTARVLRLVNSPFYGFPRRIATVTEAVMILGFSPLRNLLLAASAVDLLTAEESDHFSPMALWNHSVGTAVAAGLIARHTRLGDREEVFVAGLLHDVGKLVEFKFLREKFLEVVAVARAENIPVRVAEQRLLGFSHDQVGCLLADRWKLPVRLTESIACHHRPELAQTAKAEAAIVHVADVLCGALGLGSAGDDAVPPLHDEVCDQLGLSLADLEPLMEETEAQYEETLAILMVSVRTPAQRKTQRQMAQISRTRHPSPPEGRGQGYEWVINLEAEP